MWNKKDNVPFATRRELVVAIALACLNIALVGILIYFANVNPAIISISVVLLYLIEIIMLGSVRVKNQRSIPELGIHEMLLEESRVIIKNTNRPFAAFDARIRGRSY